MTLCNFQTFIRPNVISDGPTKTYLIRKLGCPRRWDFTVAGADVTTGMCTCGGRSSGAVDASWGLDDEYVYKWAGTADAGCYGNTHTLVHTVVSTTLQAAQLN